MTTISRNFFGVCLLSVSSLMAGTVTLDFNGINNGFSPVDIGLYYAGGAAGNGFGPGPNDGITALYGSEFTEPWIIQDALGFPLHGANGLRTDSVFTGTISFDYSSRVNGENGFGSVAVADRDGNTLGSQLFPTDITGFRPISLSFQGQATELIFGQSANAGDFTFDNIVFSDIVGVTDAPVSANAPEPGTWAAGLGILLMFASRLRRKRTT